MKTRLNKKLAVLLALVMVIGTMAVGCGDKPAASDDNFKIGIVQIVEHSSLDQIRESIIAQMAEEGFVDGENITIDYKNAQNDPNNLKTICQSFVSDGVDLIIAIATPSAQAALGETKDIPIIFSAVTDPVGSGLVEDMDNPGGNITGTSDAVSVSQIMDLASEITPEIKTIGALYNSSETNSISVIEDLKEYAKAKGLKVVEATVTNTNEVQQSAQYLAGKVDAVFSPIDNTVASAMAVASDVFNKAKIPFYVSADSMVKDGGLATCGINYTVLGQETGKMVCQVLNGTEVGTIPAITMTDMAVYVNTNTANTIGISIPTSVMEKATDMAE